MAHATAQRSQLLSRLHNARAETDALFGMVKPEFLFERPISERHRLAFYIGHLESFDWNLLSSSLGISSDREALDKLFAFGIDPVDGTLPNDQPSDWPPLETFYHYRDQVRADLGAAFDRGDHAVDGIRLDQLRMDQLINVAVEHRQMHAETLSYLLQQMPFHAKHGSTTRGGTTRRVVVPQTVSVPAGSTRLGLGSTSGEFGWDNEFEAHTVDVPAFVIDKYKVTNGQYLSFINDGGYSHREFWSDEDWEWRTTHAIQYPAFFLRQNHEWFWRAMFEAIPLPLHWPVYVSHAEASAYARWAGRALPTESQWQRACFGADDAAAIENVTGNLPRFDPLPVDDPTLIASGPFSVIGMRGNGWEWTSSVFAPFAGFRRLDFYPGYSEPFFDGKHFVLKGGSVRTAASMLRPSFRNWFQPHYPYVYAGFRCVDR